MILRYSNVVSVKSAFFLAVTLLSAPFCAAQKATVQHDCTTHGFFLHKTSCLCGEAIIVDGDIVLSPDAAGLDDTLDVELRDKAGKVLELKRLSYRKDRTFCFSGRPKGVYAVALISYKSGEAQLAAVHPVKYTAKGCGAIHILYPVPPDCPK